MAALTSGREALMNAFHGYVQHIALSSTSDLVVRRADDGPTTGRSGDVKVGFEGGGRRCKFDGVTSRQASHVAKCGSYRKGERRMRLGAERGDQTGIVKADRPLPEITHLHQFARGHCEEASNA